MAENKALFVVSFGTSYPETREKTITVIENDLKQAFPDRSFYSAWTSSFIRKKILKRDGETIPSVTDALEQMKTDGITDVLIQPTHLLAGEEYEKILNEVKAFAGTFKTVTAGRALLESREDIPELVEKLRAMYTQTEVDQMVVFMGHGSDALRFPVYDLINEEFEKSDRPEMVLGTVEFEPGFAPVLAKLRERKPKKVFLAPLLFVAGDHANNDMAGDDPDSWKMRIQSENIEVECILRGLGEYPEIRAMYLERAKNAKEV